MADELMSKQEQEKFSFLQIYRMQNLTTNLQCCNFQWNFWSKVKNVLVHYSAELLSEQVCSFVQGGPKVVSGEGLGDYKLGCTCYNFIGPCVLDGVGGPGR